jgi:SNF2 family DNA or RNA helicase
VKDERVEMSEDQLEFYKHAEKTAVLQLSEDDTALTTAGMFDFASAAATASLPPIVMSNAMARFTRLHQIASDPQHFKQVHGGKEEWLKEFVFSGGGPAVIMARYVQSANTIRKLLDELQAHPEVPWDYDPDKWIVGTYAALSHGHNLQRYNVLVAWDSTWQRLEWEQALGRIRRPGQLRNMTVYRLLAANSVDYNVQRAVDSKMTEVEMVIQWLRGAGA